jgi:oxygen-independent coproporphyrinogen III oxidase
MTVPIGLYLHVPFCRQRCDFCAFYLELYREPAAAAFLRALDTEIRLHAAENDMQKRELQSIYFGGGTPTVLKADQLIAVLTGIRQSFLLAPHCEITIEAHPSTVTGADLTALRHAGFNRVSFGAESMQDDELVGIGRPGTVHDTTAAVQAARKAGFSIINLDLMYGLPNQTVDGWKETLLRCVTLGPEHLSCYALTVEAGTKLAHDVRLQHRQAPDESLQVAMDQAAQHVLSDAGFQQYEISNYARPGCQCRHNLLYWTQGDYLGLGPSAQSYVGGVRFGNIANLAAYMAALAEGKLPIHDRTTLTEEEQLRDAVIFGLRLVQGIPTRHLRAHAKNYDYAEIVEALRAGELIEEDGERSRLSAQGRLHADTIAEKLF